MKRRYWFLGLFLAFLVSLFVLAIRLTSGESGAVRALRAKCDRIELGMTRRQVTELLGGPPGNYGGSYSIVGPNWDHKQTKEWWYPEAAILVELQRGKVTNKGVYPGKRGPLESVLSAVLPRPTGPPAGPLQTLVMSDVANDFMSAIADGRVEHAYELTTAQFQQRRSLAEFRAFVGRYPPLDAQDSKSHGYQTNGLPGPAPVPPGTPAVLKIALHDEKGSVSLTLVLKQVGVLCEVDDMTVP